MASASLNIEAKLQELIPEQIGAPHEELFRAARYALSCGKRLRPQLVLASAALYDVEEEVALLPACALELIHTYSLIHDDLPCMDDDDMRRGQPTLHKVFSEGHAVLTGDFLLTYPFELLSEAPGIGADVRLELIRTLSSSAGSEGMVGGQVVDISASCNPHREWINRRKTGALFGAALAFGAILGKAPAKEQKLLQLAGEHLGIAFQIADDLLDKGSEGEDKEQGQHNLKTALELLSALPRDAAPLLFLVKQIFPLEFSPSLCHPT